jgi:glycine/D-amino acid oxidase-like deaminating enzyme
LTRTIVVIGAGAIGLAVAWRLGELKAGQIIVIERERSIGLGSTARANGGIRAQFGTRVNIEFSLFSLETYSRLQASEPGIGLKAVGYLFMAGTAEAEAALRRNYKLQQALNVGTKWLTPDGVVERAPFIRQDGLRAGTFREKDGILDPSAVLARLALESRRAGARISFESELTGLTPMADDRLALHTSSGTIIADVAINCAGPYAAKVASLIDIDLPVAPVRRNLACTEPIAGIPKVIPMCVDLDTGVLIRREGAGVLIAYSNPKDTPSWETSFDESFLEAVAGLAKNRFPFLEAAQIDRRKCWAGLYPETPDHQPIIGALAQTPGFIQCVGFGGHGLMHAPAAAQSVAELVVEGQCRSFDISPFRPDRFSAGRLEPETAIL